MTSVLAASLAFALNSDDRVLFYGDSITENGLYATYVETFVRTRYPESDVRFYLAGVGGDTVWGGWTGSAEERVARDVAPWRPTRVTVMLGMNDAGYVPYDDRIESVFADHYAKLIAGLKAAAPGAKLTLIQTTPYDDVTGRTSAFGGYNETLLKFGRHVSRLAEESGAEYVDLNAPLVELIRKAKGAGGDRAAEIVPDHIHPGAGGHLAMAAELLRHWGASGEVWSLEIDLGVGTVVRSSGTEVSGLSGMAWSQKDAALPFPVGDEIRWVADLIGFDEAMNRQRLVLKGLSAGRYGLTIDGEVVVTLSHEEWARGVNLARYDTPMRKQGQYLFQLVAQKNRLEHLARLEVGFVLGEYEGSKNAATALRELAAEIDERARRSNNPTARHYKLTLEQ